MSEQTTRDDLDAIRKRAEKATEGPWRLWNGWGPTSDGLMGFTRLGPQNGDRVLIHDDQRDLYARREDAEFIAHARTDIPALLKVIDRIRKLAEEDDDDQTTVSTATIRAILDTADQEARDV